MGRKKEGSMRGRTWLLMGMVLAVVVTGLVSAGAGASGRVAAGTQPATTNRSVTPQSCFSSGSGATGYRVCVSTHGNVYSIQAPIGNEHVNVGTVLEGYGICSNTGYVYDSGSYEGGFGAQTISQPGGPNTFPLSIARSGGGFRVTQTYARDATQRELNITFAVRNTTASSKTNVYINRFFDGDLDNNTSNVYDASLDAVWGRNVHGLALQAVALAQTHYVQIETFSELLGNLATGTCNIPNTAGPVTGDYSGVVSYYFPSIAAGATKTVKFTYRII
jgi:hypothetical protein